MGKLNKRYNGESIYRCIDSGKEIAVFGTIKCPHCGFHDDVIPGSGRRRFWCMNCKANTCGRPECDACRPWEKQLEAYEAGIPFEQMPVKTSVPTFQLILPESARAPDSAAFGDVHGAAGGLDVVSAGHSEWWPEVSGTWSEAFNGTAEGCAGVPVLHGEGSGTVGTQPVDSGSVD